MKTFPRYLINHINLSDTLLSPDIDMKGKGNYMVFWWKDIGLGQFFIEPNKLLSENEYNEQLINAIEPAISFYAGKENIAANKWKYWLKHKMFDDWACWMNTLFAKFIPETVRASVPVSVVICTRNRASYLQQCLNRLKELACAADEIVVVDNAPVDETTQNVVENFTGAKYVREPRAGLDIARNTGILNATNPIIAFVDDDVCVHPLWALRVWETFQNSPVAAMTGLVIASQLDTEAQLIFEKYWSFNRGYVDVMYDGVFFKSTLLKGPPVWQIGAGANMAFRRSVFEKTGYFNELLDAGAAGCNGDSEMWFRILSEGYTIHYNPRAVAYHEHRREIKAVKKQIFYYMRGFTVAALFQQKQRPESGYKKYKLKKFPIYFAILILKAFPHYDSRFRTLWSEVRGIVSGVIFYRRHRNRFS